MKATQILSEMGRMWKELSEEAKSVQSANKVVIARSIMLPYEAEKEVFDEEMAEWKKTHPEEKKEKKARAF